MTITEYFKDWYKVIDTKELYSVLNELQNLYSSRSVFPEYKDIFKAFTLCPYNKCRIIFIGQDPYPQKGVATGILFGNKVNTLGKPFPLLYKLLKTQL